MSNEWYPGAWGKLTRASVGHSEFLSLSSHCADVAAVTAKLLALPVWRARMERLAGRPLDESDLARLSAIAYLHDLGKCSAGFWLKQLDALTEDGSVDISHRIQVLKRIGGDLSECGHGAYVVPTVLDWGRTRDLLGGHPVASLLKDSNGQLLIAAVSHHGLPVDFQTSKRLIWTWSDVKELDYQPLSELKSLFDALHTMMPDATTPGPPLPNTPEFVHAFCGLVSLADWIGSNPDPSFFPYDLAPPHARFETAKSRAGEVLSKMRIDTRDAVNDLRSRKVVFGDVFQDSVSAKPFQPTAVQRAAGDPELGQVVIIEDETGAGKTEAALWRYKTLFEAGEVDSLAFVLPTRVSAIALADRLQKFVGELFADESLRPNTVTAVPGYLVSDGLTGQRLAPFEVQWPDREHEASAHRHWAAENSKRYLAAAVAIGTVDQALLAGLKSRHGHLRGITLLRSLLVVDEVHASDIYMSRVLENLLSRQVRAGGHALLLSATLGSAAKTRFLNCARSRPALTEFPADVTDPLSIPYPALSDENSVRGFAPRDKKKAVTIDLQPAIAEPAAIAGFALQAARSGARVLVIRNTVAQAIETQQALVATDASIALLFSVNGKPCPHHGRFAAVDRKVLDRQVVSVFGKDAASRACILVGTQTLEQSLDIDADLLITDLCPIDVMLQRLGRLHRHLRLRPEGFELPRAVVLTPDERSMTGYLGRRPAGTSAGLGTVYTNLLAIEATWRELENRQFLSIPDDNRELVERATDYDRLNLLATELGSEWIAHWMDLLGTDTARRQAAKPRLLEWTEEFSAYTESAEVQTRLGEMPRLLRFSETVSPFGQHLTELQIPHFMWPEGCEQEEVSLDTRLPGITFTVGEQGFLYDELGLRKQVVSLG